MITTLYFIQLLAFQLWRLSSSQVTHAALPGYLVSLLPHKSRYRIAGSGLFVLSLAAFVMRLGWMSGFCAGMAGLMGVGSLVVILHPFRYINEKGLALFYLVFLALEFLI
jgi:hypothetical protein